MQYLFQAKADATTITTDCVVVGVYQDQQLSSAAAHIDQASHGAIRQYLSFGDFKGKKEQTSFLYQLPNVKATRVLLVGLGEKSTFNLSTLTQVTQSTASALKKAQIQQVTSFLSDESPNTIAVRQSVMNVGASLYTFTQHKSKPDPAPLLDSWTLAHTGSDDLSRAVTEGSAIVAGMNLARDLGNLAPNVCTPTYLAQQARQIATEYANVQFDVLEESDMERLGMGAFMSVSKGSAQPGKMVILHYRGAGEQAPLVLVGKGITFDTGGISLKPGAAMDEMKFDMCGAASALGTFKACVSLQLPLNLIAILAAAENMPSGKASKPGDIVTSMAGKTIEILNTDAEGRLVLCDALTYAERFKPAAVIDIATLTGACITALGHHTSGLLSNNDKLADEVLAAGKQAQDETWRLPMNDKYQDQLKSNFADLANIGGPAAGTITAACFLARFTESYPWVHLDIAGVAWWSGANKGATGRPVPLLTQWLLNRIAT